MSSLPTSLGRNLTLATPCLQVSMKSFDVTMKDVSNDGLARGVEQIQKVCYSLFRMAIREDMRGSDFVLHHHHHCRIQPHAEESLLIKVFADYFRRRM